jgi:hypothetical protein
LSVDTQLASTSVPIAYFAQLDFVGGMQRLTSWNVSLTWGGYLWIGLGALVSVSKVEQTERPAYPALDLALAVSSDMLALARGNVTNYRGRSAMLYRYIMSDDHQYLGDPELVWTGEMSQVRVDTGNGKGGTIALRCEQRGRSQRNASSLRLVAAQHEVLYPGDTAFRHKEQLIQKPQLWLSKKFQTL